MFVRARGNSHQLISTYREGGRVKQRILANLGAFPSLEAAVLADPERFGHLLDRAGPGATVVSGVVAPSPIPATPEEIEATADAALRAEVTTALMPLIPLARLINSPQKREAIGNAFYRPWGEKRPPVDTFVRSVRLVAAILPGLLSDLDIEPRAKGKSRAARWSEAKDEALDALRRMQELKDECSTWREAIPEQLADGQQATVDMLDAIEEIDVESVISDVEALDEPDFPRGFGRD